MKTIFFIFSCAFSFAALAASQPELISDSKNLRSSQALTVLFDGTKVKAQLKTGFHFNEKAPNSLRLGDQNFKPEILTAQEIAFADVQVADKPLSLSLYVCDDSLTYCETHRFHLKTKAKTAVSKSSESSKVSGKVNKHGFIENDMRQALQLSKQKKRLILIDFAARWCPGCVRLENEIFDLSAFKKMTSNYVKLKIDTDLFQNAIFSEKYNIYGIPTLMVINSDQKEVARIVDYQPLSVQEAFLKDVQNFPLALDEFAKSAKDPAQMRLAGQRLGVAGRFAEAIALLKDLNPVPPELIYAEVEAARKNAEKQPKDFEKTLQRAIQAESNSSRSIGWRKDAVEQSKDKAQKQKWVQEGVAVADQLLADPVALQKAVATDLVGEFTGYEAFWVAILRADLIETGGADAGFSESDIHKAWAKAGEVGEKLKIKPEMKGPALRYLLIVTESKDFEKADAFSKSMLKFDPQNWDVARRRLKILIELKKYDEAIAIGKKALKHSYDRNQYWVAENLAKAYILAQKKFEARALITEFLNKPEASWKSVQSSRKKLEELKEQANF